MAIETKDNCRPTVDHKETNERLKQGINSFRNTL